MTREKELAKNTAILTAGKICTQCVNMFLLPLYTAILDTSEYGIFDLVITYGSLLIPIVGCQLDQGIFRFLIEHRDNKAEQDKIFSSVVVADVVVSLFFLAFMNIVGVIIGLNYKNFLALYVIFHIFISLLMQYARGVGNNKIYAIGSFLSASMTVFLNFLLLAVVKMGLDGLYVATISAQILTLIYFCCSIKPWRSFKFHFIKVSTLKPVVKYSVPLIPNELSWWVVNVSDRAIVSWVLGVSVNGIYTVANKFSNIFISFYNVFNMSWTETVSLHYDDEDGKLFLSETITIMFKLFSSAGLGLVAIMPFIFPIMVNEKYIEAYNQIIILIYAMLLRVIVGLYSAIYVATKETKRIAYTSVCAALINILVNVLLIHRIGLYAASISTAIAFGAMAVIRIVDINRKAQIKIARKVYVNTIIVSTLLTFSYYINNIVINVLMLISVSVYIVIINYDMIKYILKKISECLKKN